MEWNPPDTWDRMSAFLRGLPRIVGETPRAIVVISGHWEESPLAVTAAPSPSLLYDYYGFPPHTYELKYPAPGSPKLAARVAGLVNARLETERGFDHGVFIPFKLIYPDANVPVVQLSLKSGLDAAEHIRIGQALAPLRKEGVLIVGSGMSFHNLRAFGPAAGTPSVQFDEWLSAAVCAPDSGQRNQLLTSWKNAPSARFAHPREEHLLPLMVAAGAAGSDPGQRLFEDTVMGAKVSAFGFGIQNGV